jgi:dATP pyrophosphohydrolase
MPNIVSQIVEVTIFKKHSGRPLFLILRRAEDDRLYPGIWQIVTGMIEEGEETVQAALREVREETGLAPRKLWRLPLVNSFFDPAGDRLHLCPNFAVAVDEDAEPVLSKEHRAAEWCSLERALTLLPWTGQRNAVEMVFERFWNETDEARLLEIPIPS